MSTLQHLRTAALAVGYTLPMFILVFPVHIPSRFLWSSLAEHRAATDLLLLLGCLCLVFLAQWQPRLQLPVLLGGRRAAANEIVSLPVDELFDATNGFSELSELGRGGFGVVYGTRGALRSLSREGRCAIKRLHNSKPETFAGLRREMGLLGKCRHENLLPLLGTCLDRAALCLVYPLMVGGNLDDRLRRSDAALRRIAQLQPRGQLHTPTISPLDWRARLRIVRDVTRALVYLHTPRGAKGVVLHRDVKPTNILLDEQLNAKLSDVELAVESRELSAGRTHVSSQAMVGWRSATNCDGCDGLPPIATDCQGSHWRLPIRLPGSCLCPCSRLPAALLLIHLIHTPPSHSQLHRSLLPCR